MIISYIEFKKGNRVININLPSNISIKKFDDSIYLSEKNEDFIDNFFSENIDFIYAIVGKNASGKTSLLQDVINILEGDYDDDYIVIFEKYLGENIDFHIISNKSNIQIDGKKLVNIDTSIFYEDHSSILLTNMVDDNELYEFTKNIFNLSKTYLIDEAQDLYVFFNDEMKRNIDFVIKYKNDINISRYMDLPEELRFSLEIGDLFKYMVRESFIQNLIRLAYKKYTSTFMHQIINITSENLNKEFIEMVSHNNHMDYEEIANYFFLNNEKFDKIIEKIIEVLPDIISLKKKEWISINSRNSKRNIDKSNKIQRSYETFSKDIKQDAKNNLVNNIFFNRLSYNNDYQVNLNQVTYFTDMLKEWSILLERYSDFEDKSEIFENKNLFFSGNSNVNAVNELVNFKEELKYNWEDEITYSWRNLSSGENAFLSIFSRLHEVKHDLKKNILLFIDEGDMSFHPEWQQQWVYILTNILEKTFKDYRFQIIVSTHSPFILSDLPNKNILLLGKSDNSDTHDLNLSFGSNIQELLAHNFFISSGMTGEFAKNKINNVVNNLLRNDTCADDLTESKKVINMIGEPLVRKKVHDLYIEKMNNINNLEVRMNDLQKQIEELKGKLGEDK
ncbi:ATP-binding protein [Enterococcus casseliflavus]|uniref:AAA family ATPase n=1 Tax=Enterococcus casseliflavus TaxID=37734 RepID=UPI000EAF3E25|nr:AAA family ATPase [Enterococcus casseliflavus]AYJ44656.1 ATP-binding protein [Enterococcus casseliflavus]